MIWWAIVAGGLIGWIASEFETWGFVLGGLVGLPMGKWLQSLIRDEARRAVAAQLAQVAPAHPIAEPAIEQAEPYDPRDSFTPPPEPEADAAAAPEVSPEHAPEDAYVAPEPSLAQIRYDMPESAGSGVVRTTEDLFGKARDWLLGGNTIVRVGLVILFIGLVFLARLVANAGLFPIEARLATVGAAGAALLGFGFVKRLQRPDYALHLQGAGVAVLYLTVFAAARIYAVMPPGAAFLFMILFAGLGAALAVMQDSLVMALASFIGGFAVPLLLGGHAETPLGLFTYFTILNLAIMAIAWKKSWRALNLLGFAATFVLAGVWGMTSYEDRFFMITQLFLAGSIAIYLATALLYAHNTPGKLGNFADSTLLFGTALVGFGLQAGLVHNRPYASAWSALAFAAVYLAVTAWTFSKKRPEMRLLGECLLAIGVGFVTLAVPLALEVRWTSAAWALEGLGAFWVGMRQARWMPRAFGLLLQAAAALVCLETMGANISSIPFINNGFISPMLIALPLLLTAWWLRDDLAHSGSDWARLWSPVEQGLRYPWFLAGFLFLAIAGFAEITRELPAATSEDWAHPVLAEWKMNLAALLLMLGLMSLFDWLGRARDWAVATWPGRASLFVLALCFLGTLISSRHVLTWPDLLVWILAAALHIWLLHRQDRGSGEHGSRWNGMVHTGGALLATAMVADSLYLAVERADLWDSSWAGVVFLIAATAMLAGLTRWAGRALPAGSAMLAWPLNVHARAYWWRAALVLAVLVWLGAFSTAWFAEGVTDPLPFVPLINPVDLSVALAIVALAWWNRMLARASKPPVLAEALAGNGGISLLAILAFVWINTGWLRTAHHLLGIGWSSLDLFASPSVQTGLSILWTLVAMGLMLFAHRRALRLAWLVGAALLGAVVVKLLFLDMAQAEGLARIIAFIAVGLIMLAIGWFVPLPPRKSEEKPS